ncbi:DUF6020 family protein [Neobacillus niacini]|uniref:DUF6020 family protein n=1 Tax=Neobacillus niacini TaxID=86668 RepID=UPI00286B1D4E|nr:DUF6020 family protein [Neobacillus niacini]
MISSKGPQLYLSDNHPYIVIYVYLATFFVILTFILALAGILLSLKENSVSTVSRWKILIYALPYMMIWSIYLIAFFPAILSIDSMQQWDQAHVPYFHDWHPVPHTWFIMLSTSVWDSPAAVAAAQSIILSLIFGYCAYCFEKYRVNKIVIYLMLLVTAIIPVTGIYSVNLWKDVLFSAAILLFSMYLVNIIVSNGKWMSSKTNMLFFVLASYGLVFFRHNGFPVFVVTIFLLFIVFRLKLLRTYIVSAFIIALYFFIKGPVYNYLDVIPATQNEALAIPTQQIAAVVQESGKLTEEQRDFIDKILPIEIWKKKYNPYIVDPLKFDENYNADFIQDNKKEYFRTWLEISKQNPEIVTRAYLKESSLVWQIHNEPGTYFLPFLLRSDPQDMAIQRGIQHQIKNQTLTAKAQGLLAKTVQQPFYWMWRPALFSFAILLFVFILILKGRWKLILAAAPVMLNTAAVAISLPAQDFRYLYANFLVAFIMFLAACLGKKEIIKVEKN